MLSPGQSGLPSVEHVPGLGLVYISTMRMTTSRNLLSKIECEDAESFEQNRVVGFESTRDERESFSNFFLHGQLHPPSLAA